MNLQYRYSVYPAAGSTLLLHLGIENRTEKTWLRGRGFVVGSQVYDPETYTLVFEGRRVSIDRDLRPGEVAEVDLPLELPSDSGRYRVFVSPMLEGVRWFYEDGWPFLLLDADVRDGRVVAWRVRVTTRRRLRAWLALRSLARGFQYPARSLWRNRSLIRSLVRRDILGRYRGSAAGLFWTVLNPLLLMATYFFVFGVVLRTRLGSDPSRSGFVLYFLAGMLPWLAFSEAAGRAPFLILEHRNFVKKLVFPLETLPMNVVIAGLVTEGFALGIFLVALLLVRGTVPWSVLWLPVLLVPQLLFTMGLCWFLAALGAYLRDLGQVIGFLLTLWFFLTPICYPVGSLPSPVLPLLSRNPLFVLVEGYRAVLLESQPPPWPPVWKLWLVSLAVFLAGYAWFHKLQKNFADVI